MSSLIEQYLIWLKGGHSLATVFSYKWALRSFEKWLTENQRAVESCGLAEISNYLNSLENRGLRGGTRAIYATAVKNLYKWLQAQDLTHWDWRLIPIPLRLDVQSYARLTEEDYQKFISYFDESFPKDLRNKTIVSFLYATGIRLSELISLDCADIDLENQKAIVKTFKRKNHKREIYWSEETNCLLIQWLAMRDKLLKRFNRDSNALFITLDSNQGGQRIGRCAIQRIFRLNRQKAGIDKKITAHSCRHGFATKGVKNNINLRYLQLMMGHANLKNTQVYLGWENKDVEGEYRKIYEKPKSKKFEPFFKREIKWEELKESI